MLKTRLSLLAIATQLIFAGHAFAVAPGAPQIKWESANALKSLALVEVEPDSMIYEKGVKRHPNVKVNLVWDVYTNDNATTASVLLDGAEVWKGPASSKSASFSVSRGGKFKLKVVTCNATNECTSSQEFDMTVADTDGVHMDPLVVSMKDNNNLFQRPKNTVVGTYYTEWSPYGRNFKVEDIPAPNLTHILYGFIPICGGDGLNDSLKTIQGSFQALQTACQGREDFKVTIHDMYAALNKDSLMGYGKPYAGNFGKLMALKKAYPHLKILPSVGGWTLSDPFFFFDNPKHRKTFVDSAKEFLLTWKFFDGIDIDWEFPGGGGENPKLGKPGDKAVYTALMKELRVMLDELSKETGRKYELTTAIGAGEAKIASVDYKEAQKYLDHIFLMSYDFAGAFDLNNLNHQTNLYTANDIGVTSEHSTDKAVNALLNQGVQSKKIIVGVAEYGRGWDGVSGYQAGKPFTGKAKGPVAGGIEPGFLTYKQVYDQLKSGAYKEGYDDKAQAAYAFNETNKSLLTYDNARSVKAKGKYVLNKGLGGLFSWEIGNSNGDILNAMHEGLGGAGGDTGANRPPVAVAGSQQTVTGPAKVTLNGSGSYDPDNEKLTYRWSQITGTHVTLSDPSSASPTFTAPATNQSEDMLFELIVNDGKEDSKPARVVVKNMPSQQQPPVDEVPDNDKPVTPPDNDKPVTPPDNDTPVTPPDNDKPVTPPDNDKPDVEQPQAPQANIQVNSSPLIGATSAPVTRAMSGSGSQHAVSYTWKVVGNNGFKLQAGTRGALANQVEGANVYAVAPANITGNATYSLTVKNSAGKTDTKTVTINVVKPRVSISGSTSVKQGEIARLKATPNFTATSYTWLLKTNNRTVQRGNNNEWSLDTTGLQPGQYQISLQASDNSRMVTMVSSLTITPAETTPVPPTPVPPVPGAQEWKLGGSYTAGQVVTYQGKNYRALVAHTAYDPNWNPVMAQSLWSPVN